MSVTFSIQGVELSWDHNSQVGSEELGYMNLSNSNARNILETLGIESEDLCGTIRAGELRSKCAIALRNILQNGDPAVPTVVDSAPGKATVVYCGRDAGYLTERIHRLLCLAKKAGDIGVVSWG